MTKTDGNQGHGWTWQIQIYGGVKPDITNTKTYGNQDHGLGRETQMSNMWRS